MSKIELRFREWDCYLKFNTYIHDSSTHMMLLDKHTNYPIATVTVCIDGSDLLEDEVAIKDYSENEGMLNCLIKNNVVSEPVRHVDSGYVKIPVCKLLVDKNYEI